MFTLEEIIPPAITLGWDEARIINSDPGEDARVCTVLGRVRDIHATALPDLDDPATLGCLLALVREALAKTLRHGHRAYACTTLTGQWVVMCSGNPHWPDGIVGCAQFDTEAAALVAALEAAP